MRIAFIGLGQTGRPMAEDLVRAGHALVAEAMVLGCKTGIGRSGQAGT